MMNRREMILRTGAAALGLGLAGCSSWRPDPVSDKPRKVLFFSKSSGFEHSVIKSVNGQPSFAQNILTELGPKHNIEFTFSKDGSLFTPQYLAQFDAYFFYTTGTLTEVGTDKNPAMTHEGKAAFLDAIHRGKGFIGTHAASDTFHTGEEGAPKEQWPPRNKNYGEKADPYVRMLGAEFIRHDAQQVANLKVVDHKFPGFHDLPDTISLKEEWYSLKDFSPNLHVLCVQETEGMKGPHYERPDYPETWARMYGKGRVFYTSMGHREDVWENPMFHDILFGGITWAVRNANADVTPNLLQVCPKAMEVPAAG